MRSAAKHNLHATESTPQTLTLHFIDAEGEDLDLTGYTLTGAVEQEGILALKCAFTDASNATVEFPSLAAGRAVYDLFLRDGAGKEYPLIFGAIHVLARCTPPAEETDGDAPITEGIDVTIPEATDAQITVVDNPALVTAAQVSAATAAAETATTAATSAEDAAERAEAALEQIPVDGGGNMSISGGLTVGGVANLNGGASVPRYSTNGDTDVVYRRFAMGCGPVADLFNLPRYYRTFSIKAGEGTLARGWDDTYIHANFQPNSSVILYYDNTPLTEYNATNGIVIPLRGNKASDWKITTSIGLAMNNFGAGINGFSHLPTSNPSKFALNSFDITAFKNDAGNECYCRVRALYPSNSPYKWKVYTSYAKITRAQMAYISGLVIAFPLNSTQGGLYLSCTGLNTKGLYKIANLPGITSGDASWFKTIALDTGDDECDIYIGAKLTHLFTPNNRGCDSYDVLESIAVNKIDRESDEDFPLSTEV